LKSVSGKVLARLLEQHGWQLKRTTGSHHTYAKPDNPARISLPIHGNPSLKTGYFGIFSSCPASTKKSCSVAMRNAIVQVPINQ
jgi:predicted RNA binding protein YcfA (HicA-like mRNA interferase family)